MISALLPIFTETILPVFLIAAAGALLASLIKLDHRTLGRTVFYMGTPALIFRSLYVTEFDWATLQRAGWRLDDRHAGDGISQLVAQRRAGTRQRAAIILTSAMSNNGNGGFRSAILPLAKWVWHWRRSIHYHFVSGNTLGIVVASSGRMSIWKAIREAFKAPMLYAAVIGLLFNRLNWELPVPIFRSIDLLADAAIPLMLIVLGVQLRTIFAGTVRGWCCAVSASACWRVHLWRGQSVSFGDFGARTQRDDHSGVDAHGSDHIGRCHRV
jgi:hypothetical protein